MKLASFKCDYCDTHKGESNHWWLRFKRSAAFLLFPWDEVKAQSGDHEHICSESCASKALSVWMAR